MIILDDAGRAALKVGDEVLVRMKIARDLDADLDFRMATANSSSSYTKPADIFALLPEPIAVGDKLRFMRRQEGHVCVGFTSDGKIVAEYQAGEDTAVVAYDASCWEKVS